MQELKELVYFVDKHVSKKGGALDAQITGTKIRQFYESLLKQKITSDEDAIAQLYSVGEHSASAYRKLKNSLKQRLIDLVFSIGVRYPVSNDRQKAYYVCCKDWAAAKILLGKNARLSGVELCEKLLKEAALFEFSELCRDACGVLRLHYGAMIGDEKRFEYYNEQYKWYSKLCIIEDQTEELYTELTLKYVNNRSNKSGIHDKALKNYKIIQEHLSIYKSYRLHLYGRLIEMFCYESVSDHTNTLRVCKEAIHFFEAKEYQAMAPLLVFYYQKVICYILLKDEKAGKETIFQLQQFAEEGTFNWFKLQELYFTLLMHTAYYEEASQLYAAVTQHKKFSLLPSHVNETWNIYEAYLNYLCKNGKISKEASKILPRFRLGKFFNETLVFSKDKSGMNISILTVKILFSLIQKEEGSAAEQIENIRKYCSRHLSQGSTARSYYFIKMLLQIPSGNFNKPAIIRRTESLLESLKATSLDASGQSFEIEIIPYEVLWEMVLNSLAQHTPRRNTASKVETG